MVRPTTRNHQAGYQVSSPDQVTLELEPVGIREVDVRTYLRDLTDTPSEALRNSGLSQSVAVSEATAAGGRRARQIGVISASGGSARRMHNPPQGSVVVPGATIQAAG